jgi:hypothetical protein
VLARTSPVDPILTPLAVLIAERTEFEDMVRVLEVAVASTKNDLHGVQAKLNEKTETLVETQCRAIAAADQVSELKLQLENSNSLRSTQVRPCLPNLASMDREVGVTARWACMRRRRRRW